MATANVDLDTVTLSNGLTCDIPAASPLAKLLKSKRTWIGPSAKERLAILQKTKYDERAAFGDYDLYFVNPNADEILGQKVYKSLADLPVVPDIVDVFRRGSDIPSVIDDVVAVGAPVIWVQLGIWNQEAAEYGESKGLTVVMDRCIKVEHARFHGGLHLLGFDTGQITSRKTIR